MKLGSIASCSVRYCNAGTGTSAASSFPTQHLAFPASHSRLLRRAQRDCDVTPGGKLIGVVASGGAVQPLPPQIRIIQNWFSDLKQRAPVR